MKALFHMITYLNKTRSYLSFTVVGDEKMKKSSSKYLSTLLCLSIVLLATVATATLVNTKTAHAASANPYGFGVAIFKNFDAWNSAANEIVLKRFGIPYDIYNSTDMGVVNLSKYAKVVIESDQNQAFYDAVGASTAWFEDYVSKGGVLEIHAADGGWHSGHWTGNLPGGIVYSSHSDNLVSISTLSHPIVRKPNTITDTELDNWGSSFHGYFTTIPSNSITILRDSSSWYPVYIEVPYGSGVILASSQTLEYAYAHTSHYLLLENSLLYLAPYEKLDMKVNVGTVHFRGEIAEFYIETSLYGNAINASIWEATLYYNNGTQQTDLLANVETITVGLYKITYTIPADAVAGTYTLSVKASYRTGTITATAHSTASFLLSPTLTSQNSYITSISNNIATAVIPGIGSIQVNLAEINAKVVSINGTTATIKTDIGTMQTNVSNIEGLVTAIDETTKPAYWTSIAAAILAALAAVIAIVIVVLVKKKPPAQQSTQPATPPA